MAVALFVLIYSLKLVIAKQEGFIVGGDYVESIKRFPHVAFLTLQVAKSKAEYICGASVLNQLILITAAHCFDNIAGVTASVGNVDREQGKLHRVVSYKTHEKWITDDPHQLNNDIALCKLKKPLNLGRKVKKVILMRSPPTAGIAALAGWGSIDERSYTQTEQLKYTTQKLWTREQCRKFLKQIPKGTLCAGEKQARGNFASKGDSGSGLLIDNAIMVGLVSYKDTGVSRSLVIYTDVAYFYDWILRTSNQMKCSSKVRTFLL